MRNDLPGIPVAYNGKLAEEWCIPEDFIAYNILSESPRRYTKKGDDNWDVTRWSDRWEFFDNVGNETACKQYWAATNVFVAHKRPLPVGAKNDPRKRKADNFGE